MRLHCLGTVGYHPNESRHTSCYYLPESGILLDAGTGVFRLAQHIETDNLDVLLSHAHLDHTFGLTFLLDILFQRPVKKLRIWGEREKIEVISQHLFQELIFPAPLKAEWIPIDEQPTFQIGSATISWRRQQHPGGSVAYRVEWPDGKRLVYATDTTGDTSEEYARWSHNADLLMHECNFRDDSEKWAIETGHSWTSRVAEVACASKPRQLLVTHLNPLETSDDPVDIEAIRSRVDCPCQVAADEMVVDF
ncbi:MAG: MBL fold metallo-hydrolase [Planctomycetaceae bacterium]|nr:MBL fold metallo-hydrolase [Planctomycetaceae bacterium]